MTDSDAARRNDVSKKRRTGARARRRESRGGEHRKNAVGPGLSGGSFQALSSHDIERIHSRALDVLENIGMAGAFPGFLEIALAGGCRLNDYNRLCFPRALIEDIIAGAGRNFTLYGRDQKYDLDVSGTRTHFGTGGTAVKVLDLDTRSYRPSTLLDLYDCGRLVDHLDNYHFFARTVMATEIVDQYELDMSIAYTCAAATQKHIYTGFCKPEHVKDAVSMFDAILGREGGFRERPFCTANTCSIVPPLTYGEDNARVSMEAARLGMPVNMIIAAQAGSTAPAALAGTLVQTVADALAGLALVNLTVPGHPTIFSTWPFVSDLRTGAFSGGGGEEAILNAATGQITKFYDLPGGIAAGMADAKIPDNQAGYEKGITTALAGNAGANLVFESGGMLASLMGCSFESLLIDNDMLGFVQRSVRGIDVSEDTMSYEEIKAVCCDGPGHFLGTSQTLNMMDTEYQYPDLGDRTSISEWQENGATDVCERARKEVRTILSVHYPQYIKPEIDAAIRQRFPVLLPVTDMQADCGRW